MEPQKIPTQMEQMLASAQTNMPVKVLAEATKQVIANYPAPGSMEAAALTGGQKICTQCNALIRLNAKFCQSCGTVVPVIA